MENIIKSTVSNNCRLLIHGCSLIIFVVTVVTEIQTIRGRGNNAKIPRRCVKTNESHIAAAEKSASSKRSATNDRT